MILSYLISNSQDGSDIADVINSQYPNMDQIKDLTEGIRDTKIGSGNIILHNRVRTYHLYTNGLHGKDEFYQPTDYMPPYLSVYAWKRTA